MHFGSAYDQRGEAIHLKLLICKKLSEKMDDKEFGKGGREGEKEDWGK